jgi:hypothetical protein
MLASIGVNYEGGRQNERTSYCENTYLEAAMLPEHWAKHLVDISVRKLREKDIAWADIVFISGMIAQRDSAHELVARCRAAGKTIVAGGPLFTLEHEQFPEVDHFVLNEAEMTLPEFLRDFAHGAARRLYTSSNFPDIRETPVPLWELADMRRYASTSVQFSRGCPFDCEFYNVTAMFGHRPPTKTAAQVIAELDGLWRAGWRGPVFFVDDNFIGNKRALKEESLPALIQWQRGRRGLSVIAPSWRTLPKLAGERGLLAQVTESPRLNPAKSNPCRTAIRPHGWLRVRREQGDHQPWLPMLFAALTVRSTHSEFLSWIRIFSLSASHVVFMALILILLA